MATEQVRIGLVEVNKVYTLSQWQLMWLKFRRHKLAVVSGIVLILLYTATIFASFLSPYPMAFRTGRVYQPPQGVHFVDDSGFYLQPFVYAMESTRDPVTFEKIYTADRGNKLFIRFFMRSWEYRFLGLFPTNVHLFGVDEDGGIHIFGTDQLGRDLFTRILHGARISLSVGLVGLLISFALGCAIGGISGYFSGLPDLIIQRVIEFLRAIPQIPLWLALSAAMPVDWPPVRVYFGITIILAIIGWTGLARVVRGKLLQIRTEDYVMAAQISGASEFRVILRHMLPGMASHLIVSLTLSVPGMIIGETSLSFLGLGLRPPVVSWGVLLQEAQKVDTLYLHPWILIPAIFVVVLVLAYNGLGDGLRDAADPYVR